MIPYPGVTRVIVWEWPCPLCKETQRIDYDEVRILIEDREPWMTCWPCRHWAELRTDRSRGGG